MGTFMGLLMAVVALGCGALAYVYHAEWMILGLFLLVVAAPAAISEGRRYLSDRRKSNDQ